MRFKTDVFLVESDFDVISLEDLVRRSLNDDFFSTDEAILCVNSLVPWKKAKSQCFHCSIPWVGMAY